MADRVDLYSYVPSPGENIPVTVAPAKVNNSVPTEDEIEDAVKKLRRKRLGGLLGMRAKHLKGWLAAYNRDKRRWRREKRRQRGRRKEGNSGKNLRT